MDVADDDPSLAVIVPEDLIADDTYAVLLPTVIEGDVSLAELPDMRVVIANAVFENAYLKMGEKAEVPLLLTINPLVPDVADVPERNTTNTVKSLLPN